MPKPEIEEFAELLITEVRDRSIASCDMLLQPGSSSPPARRWQNKLSSGSAKDLAITMIPDCVDDALFHLLHAIDSGVLHVSFVAGSGNVVDLTDEGIGELAGWYMGAGWRSKYSQQRLVDDYEDLR